MKPQYAEMTLRSVGDVLAGVLSPGHKEAELSVSQLRSSEIAASFKVSVGKTVGFVKIFDVTPEAAQAFDRERKALEGFHGLLIPKLLFVAEGKRLLMTEFVVGAVLKDIVHSDNMSRIAEHMGQWIGSLHNIAPRQNHESCWSDYLKAYEKGLAPGVLDQQAAILDRIEIGHLTLAHNDNALSNFIMAEDGHLFGVDFEKARFKPEGWDLVTSARALFVLFPDSLPEISAALLRGYQLTVKDSELPMFFDQAINAVTVSNLVSET